MECLKTILRAPEARSQENSVKGTPCILDDLLGWERAEIGFIFGILPASMCPKRAGPGWRSLACWAGP